MLSMSPDLQGDCEDFVGSVSIRFSSQGHPEWGQAELGKKEGVRSCLERWKDGGLGVLSLVKERARGKGVAWK